MNVTRKQGGSLSRVSGTKCSRARESAASAAGNVSIWIMTPDILTCGVQPESHQSLPTKPAGCGLRRQRGAAGEGRRQSARHAVECSHTSRSPAEDGGENEIAAEREGERES